MELKETELIQAGPLDPTGRPANGCGVSSPDRTYLGGRDLAEALDAALRLSPSERAWDKEFGRLSMFLDHQHVRRDLRQRVLAKALIHTSPTSSSPWRRRRPVMAPSERSIRRGVRRGRF
jgi:hypothetical protein